MSTKLELVEALNEVLREYLGGPISDLASDEQVLDYCVVALAYIQAYEVSVDPSTLAIIRRAYIDRDKKGIDR